MVQSEVSRGSGGEAPSMALTKNSVTVASYGRASSSICPRRGYVWLTHQTGVTIVMPTNCKAWACLACRDRKKSLFLMRVVYGLSTFDHFVFMTLTFETDNRPRHNAAFVEKMWRRLLMRWKRKYPSTMWLRVVEATKKKQPHLHLIISGLRRSPTQIESCGRYWTPQGRYDKCHCIQCDARREWYGVTGDSYVVDVSRVKSHNRTASYIAKYLAKGQAGFQVLKDLGFGRRWSRSNSWPSGQLRLAATAREEWVHQGFYGGNSKRLAALADIEHPLKREKEGDELSKFFEGKMLHKIKGKEITRVASIISPAVLQ